MRILPVVAALAATLSPLSATAQDGAPPLRDPASIWLPPALEAELRLGLSAPHARFAASFDRLAATGAIPVIGPETTLEIRAASDRARVFLAYMQYDLDGDATVTRGEYDTHAQISWGDTLTAREYAILDAEWAAADRDGDGAIWPSEVHALALEMHPVPDLGPLGPEGDAMLLMDLDNDGFVIWDEVDAVLSARRP